MDEWVQEVIIITCEWMKEGSNYCDLRMCEGSIDPIVAVVEKTWVFATWTFAVFWEINKLKRPKDANSATKCDGRKNLKVDGGREGRGS